MLTEETIITLANGIRKKIGQLVDTYKEDKTYRAITYNIQESVKENKTITNFIKKERTSDIIMFLVQCNGELIQLTCTNDHSIFIKSKNEYVKAEDVNENDTLVTWYNNEISEGTVFKKVNVPRKIKYVYDLNIEENNNMFANGILVYN